jgi:hypothetical protein
MALDPRIRNNEFKYLTYKILTKKFYSKKYDLGCLSRIPIFSIPDPDPGVKKAHSIPDPKHFPFTPFSPSYSRRILSAVILHL